MANESAPDSVEVVYALPDEQRVVTLPWKEGMTAADAVSASGLREAFPAINAQPLVLGIFGERVEPDHVLTAGDRVEIARPLLRDPRTLRRELSARGEVMGGAARHGGREPVSERER